MNSVQIEDQINQLAPLDSDGMHQADFLLTWDRSDEEITTRFNRFPSTVGRVTSV